MKTLSLKNIILHADFSPIQMGFTEEQVCTVLGQPENRGDMGSGSVIYQYGWYEFFFFDNALHYFQNDHVKADCSNHDEMLIYQNGHFEIDSWFLKANQDISLKEVISILKKEKADFVVKNQQTADGTDLYVGKVKILELSNGLTMDFHHETMVFEYDDEGNVVKSEGVYFLDEMDFVLNGIRYEYWVTNPLD